MDRYDPFDSMDRMFEQMRRTMMDAGMSGSGMGRPMALPAAEETDLAGHDRHGMDRFGSAGMDQFGSGDAHVRLEPTDDGYVAIADLPGFEQDEITVTVRDGVLAIEAVHEASEDDEMSVRRTTRQVRETVRVPDDLQEDAIRATYRNGVLEIDLPMLEADDEGRVIDIE